MFCDAQKIGRLMAWRRPVATTPSPFRQSIGNSLEDPDSTEMPHSGGFRQASDDGVQV
jgi:hypothetical protein